METIGVLLKVLEQGLILWNSKEKTKYLDKLISLKKDWYEEYNKPISERSDNRLDDIEFELRLLSDAFVQAAQSKDSTDK